MTWFVSCNIPPDVGSKFTDLVSLKFPNFGPDDSKNVHDSCHSYFKESLESKDFDITALGIAL